MNDFNNWYINHRKLIQDSAIAFVLLAHIIIFMGGIFIAAQLTVPSMWTNFETNPYSNSCRFSYEGYAFGILVLYGIFHSSILFYKFSKDLKVFERFKVSYLIRIFRDCMMA